MPDEVDIEDMVIIVDWLDSFGLLGEFNKSFYINLMRQLDSPHFVVSGLKDDRYKYL
jgi:hypothetical protein